MAGIAAVVMLAIFMLLTWWSFEAGTELFWLAFVGLLVALVALSSKRKRDDAKARNESSNGRPAANS